MPLRVHRDGLRKKKRLHRFVQPGINRLDPTTGRNDDQSREAEDIRRRFVAAEAPAPEEEFGGGGGGVAPPVILPPPVTRPIPDREHFWSNHFVLFSNDHRQGEDNPLAPGYAPIGQASSLQGAYNKAVELVRKLSNDGRVVIIIKGGYVEESVEFNDPRIDLEGEGTPFIVGNTVIGTMATRMKIRNIRFVSENDDPAVLVMASPEVPPYRITMPGVEFHDCDFVGTTTSFETIRRVYARECSFKATDAAVVGNEDATVLVKAWPEPCGPAVFDNCYFYAREEETREFDGYAIKATAKTQAYTDQYGGYLVGTGNDPSVDAGKFLEKSGVVLKDCYISGGLLNEGWLVHHIGGWQRCGAFYPPAAGHVYCRMRGWRIMDPGLGATDGIFAYTFWTNTVTYSASIAEFVEDPNRAEHYAVGGVARYINSVHKSRFNTATPGTAFPTSAVGTAYVLHSVTAADTWGSSAIVHDSPIGPDSIYMPSLLADPLVFQ